MQIAIKELFTNHYPEFVYEYKQEIEIVNYVPVLEKITYQLNNEKVNIFSLYLGYSFKFSLLPIPSNDNSYLTPKHALESALFAYKR